MHFIVAIIICLIYKKLNYKFHFKNIKMTKKVGLYEMGKTLGQGAFGL